MEYIGVSIMVFCSALNSVGQTLFKTCVPKAGGGLGYSVWKDSRFLVGIAIYALGTLLSIYAYRFADLMILYPLTNLALIWNLVLAHRFLGEKIGPRRLVATLLILLGCFVLLH